MVERPPRILLLDGDYDNTLPIAKELDEDLDATIVGAGTTRHSRLPRSRHCDDGVLLPLPGGAAYRDALRDAVDEHQPDVVLPVGYRSTAALDAIRDDLPATTTHGLPSSDAFQRARDKVETLAHGARLGIDTPRDYTDVVRDLDADGRPQCDGEDLPTPLFLKARYEDGRSLVAGVESPAAFWETYDRIAADAPENEVIVQEWVEGPATTYGCGVLVLDGGVELEFGHEELRSIPRIGGTGTRLRVHRNAGLEALAAGLLDEIGWRGLALVEFKRRADGGYTLMEINPKFWASYALASEYGYRFASTLVADVLGLDVETPIGSPAREGEMAFPLRELNYYVRHRGSESLVDCLSTMIGPGVAWDVDLRDVAAWLTPPADLFEKTRSVPRFVHGASSHVRFPPW